MDVPEPQPDPDGGDGPGHEPGGSPQDELDFSILFDYDYLNPIEGRWRLPPAWPLSTGRDRAWEPNAGLPLVACSRGCPCPSDTEGSWRQWSKHPEGAVSSFS